MRDNCYTADSRFHSQYCNGAERAREQLGLPESIDLLRLDCLPRSVDLEYDDMKTRQVELVIRPTGMRQLEALPRPLWYNAVEAASQFTEEVGLQLGADVPALPTPTIPIYEITAEVVSAHLVRRDGDEAPVPLELVEPAPVSAEAELAFPMVATTAVGDQAAQTQERVGDDSGLHLLGIRIGQSFSDAEAIIRAHMEVGEVVKQSPNQMKAIAGMIEPFTSGTMFIAADGTERIAIFDEPSAGNALTAMRNRRGSQG